MQAAYEAHRDGRAHAATYEVVFAQAWAPESDRRRARRASTASHSSRCGINWLRGGRLTHPGEAGSNLPCSHVPRFGAPGQAHLLRSTPNRAAVLDARAAAARPRRRPSAPLVILARMEQRIELAPNCSLTPAGARLFFVCYMPVFLGFCDDFRDPGLLARAALLGARDGGAGTCPEGEHAPPLLSPRRCSSPTRVSLVTRSRRGEAKQEFARHWTKVRLRSPRTRLLSEPLDDRESWTSLRGRQFPHRGGSMPARPSVCAVWWAA